MKSARPKVMHAIAGQPMIHYVLDSVRKAGSTRTVVVVGRDMADLAQAVAPHAIAVQDPPRGTGDAVIAAKKALKTIVGDIVIVFGDTPFIEPKTITGLLAARRQPLPGGRFPSIAILGMRPREPREYGRIKLAPDGSVESIVEYKDATPEERKIGLCNSGVMAVDGKHLFALLEQIEPANAQGEFYLTDIVKVARGINMPTAVVEGSPDEFMGINSRSQLAVAEGLMQTRLRARAMAEGVTLIDPRSVTFSFDTRLGRDSVVEPNVVFGNEVQVGANVRIKAFTHIEGATIEDDAVIGPFARLRPGARIGKGAHIGNFVEVKQSEVEAGAKVNHLTYIGDARVGRGANVGAGTITCNYDGFTKSRTEIGAGAFIGSNSALVAPVTIGDGAVIGAGSVIARDVAPGALALTRAEQKEIKGWAVRRRKERTPPKRPSRPRPARVARSKPARAARRKAAKAARPRPKAKAARTARAARPRKRAAARRGRKR